jgi:predicted lysophospholipase L1 biosynthesis ABC-type transport system permease subunit
VRRAAVVLICWGLWLGALTAVQAVFAPKLIQVAIPAVASAVCVLAGLVVWALDVRQAREERPQLAYQAQGERPRLITDSSVATVTLVVGLALALVGAGFGLWLILIGAGIAALGVGGVVREQLARSRTLQRKGSR